MIAIAILLAAPAAPWGLPLQRIGEIGLWIAAVLTLVTGWGYLRQGLDFMRAKPDAGAAQ
jgi:cardiolipin synthase